MKIYKVVNGTSYDERTPADVTGELSEEFEPLGFLAPFIVVRRRNDGSKGSLEFQHSPRFYFNFQQDR